MNKEEEKEEEVKNRVDIGGFCASGMLALLAEVEWKKAERKDRGGVRLLRGAAVFWCATRVPLGKFFDVKALRRPPLRCDTHSETLKPRPLHQDHNINITSQGTL